VSAASPTLFLLPGLLCDAAAFAPQLQAFSNVADLHVANWRDLSSFQEMAQFVLDQAPARFSLLGHSMGGRVALEIAHMAPQRVEKLCLMDLSVEALREGEFAERMALVEQAEEAGMPWLADWWLTTFVPEKRRRDLQLMQGLRDMVLRHTLADYRNQITAAVTRRDQGLYLPTLPHRVLLLCGSEDNWSTPAQHQAIAARLPHAEFQQIEGAGHMPTVEAPRHVNRILTRWWLED